MKPDVRAFFDEDTNTITYVVTDPFSKVCAIIRARYEYKWH